MIVLAAVLLAALACRLGPVRRRGPAVRARVRSAPATHVYLAALLVTSWVLATSSADVARRLLLERSTNLHQLARDPVRVLVASAFWLDSSWELLPWAALFLIALVPLERRIGSARFVAVLGAGHVGATLAVAGGLWLAIRADLVRRSVSRAQDVGVSYAFFAGAAALVPMLPAPVRRLAAAVLVGWLAVGSAISPDFTAAGHVTAAAIGAAAYLVLRRRAPAATRTTVA